MDDTFFEMINSWIADDGKGTPSYLVIGIHNNLIYFSGDGFIFYILNHFIVSIYYNVQGMLFTTSEPQHTTVHQLTSYKVTRLTNKM